MKQTYWGKYPGKVVNNVDPGQRGRIQVSVPNALGEGTLSWAMPCVPFAGNGVGLFAVPPIGASVWVEFQGGDLNYPIWSGCFWGDGDSVPADPAVAQVTVLKTQTATIRLSDVPGEGGITIELQGGKSITINQMGIEINGGSLGTIKLTEQGVSINNGALEVK